MKMADKRSRNLGGAAIVVVGLGVTGIACAKSLPRLGASVVVTDVRDSLIGLENQIATVESAGARFVPRDEASKMKSDILVISPGLAPDDPRVAHFTNNTGEWVSEIELAYRISKGRILGITGTNGKTTTTTLAGRMLSAAFPDTRVAGNIGNTFMEAAVDSVDDTVFVLEISSYQLEGCSMFKPDAAIELNVQPDHLSRHPSLEIYAKVKSKLIGNMGSGTFALLNKDDELTAGMAKATKAEVIYFSTKKELAEGACVKDGALLLRRQGEEAEFCKVSALQLRGRHNLENVLAASSAAFLMGAPREVINEAALEFTGLEHRIEPAGVVRGVECVNDSKATNPDSTRAALETFAGRELTLILCGDDKGFDYTALYGEIRAAGARVVVMGKGLARIADEMEKLGGIEVRRAADMAEAVRTGLDITPENGVLLLSPGSSSFDMYRNYEERGNDFKRETAKA